MVIRFVFGVMLFIGAVCGAPYAHADPNPNAPAEDGTVTPVFDQATNIPGKSLVAVRVSYPAGGKTPSHHHASSAFIMAYVLSGEIRSQVDDQPARIYHVGETWYEEPGAHHVLSENASSTAPAELLAVFLVDTGENPLTTYDSGS